MLAVGDAHAKTELPEFPLLQDLDPESARFILKPAVGGNADGVTKARGIEGVMEAAVHLLEQVRRTPRPPNPPTSHLHQRG